MTLRTLALATLLFSLAASGADAKLPEPLRTRFAGGFQKDCRDTQLKLDNSDDERFSPPIIETYCTCLSRYVADNITPDQSTTSYADMAKDSAPAWLQAVGRVGTDYCLKALSQTLTAPR